MATQADFARELLALARDDATAASILAATDASADAIVGFHAQQAVEKSLKAVLALHGHDFPFTHNLAQLIHLTRDVEIELPDVLENVDELTPFGVSYRYTSEDLPRIDRAVVRDRAAAAVTWAQAIIDA